MNYNLSNQSERVFEEDLPFCQRVMKPDSVFVYKQLILANPGPLVIGKLHLSHFADMLGEDNIYLTVADAVEACCPKLSEEV